MRFVYIFCLLFCMAACISSSGNREPASIDRVNCANRWVFCADEFEVLARESASIAELIHALPGFIKRNLTFKRGNNIEKRTVGYLGPHGHKVSPRKSSSASPEEPRAFVWDETSGFTLSWNSGNPNHSAHDRLDIYDFDFVNKKHILKAWFPSQKDKIFGADFKPEGGQACTSCHGKVQRPIFPMYPDWPQFYGEFNDEMSSYP